MRKNKPSKLIILLCLIVFILTSGINSVSAQEKYFIFKKPHRSEVKMVEDGFLYVDVEDFSDYGGWRMDVQFVHLMGSPYLMATGIGKPVEDATTSINITKDGKYQVWVRTRNWVKDYSPGRFQVLINNTPLQKEFGAAPLDKWTWEKGGEIELAKGAMDLALHDLTGFYGRCDAILLTTDPNYVPPVKKDAICKERARLQGLSLEPEFAGKFDVIVVGGGSAGVPAAIAAARMGAKTALIQNRPTLGGNCSVECGVGVQGASQYHQGWRETGIIEEAGWIRALLEQHNYSDAFKLICDAEENLTLFLNQHVFDASMENEAKITGVKAVSTLTGLITEYHADQFIDCSGDGWLGYFAGAEYRYGRESRDEFNEDLAPEEADSITMSGSIMGDDLIYMTGFRSKKTDKPVGFVRPAWAKEIDILESPGRSFSSFGVGSWWMEHDGGINDLWQAEEARDELIKVTLSFWDYVKNKSDKKEEARNYKLVTIPIMDAKRETRRLVGDYLLTQHDVTGGRVFPDRIAFGGWSIDLHNPKGIYSGAGGSFDFAQLKVPIYTIPFRALYSKNIDNLLFAGRCGSFTHVALGSVRLQSTLATIGQAAGTAAAMCVEKGINSRSIYTNHISELQQTLLKHDQSIPELKNVDQQDLARKAKVSASSTASYSASDNVINGWTRLKENKASLWASDSLKTFPQWIELDFKKPTKLNTVHITFDTSLESRTQDKQFLEVCVKDYELSVLSGGKWVKVAEKKNNFQRHCIHNFKTIKASKLRLTVKATNGAASARVYEIRAYNE